VKDLGGGGIIDRILGKGQAVSKPGKVYRGKISAVREALITRQVWGPRGAKDDRYLKSMIQRSQSKEEAL